MRRFAVLLLLLIALAAVPGTGLAEGPSPGAQAQPATTLQAYRAQLESALQALAGRREAEARNAVAILRRLDVVRMPDGTEVHPELSAVIAALETQPPEYSRAETGLRALLGELSQTSAPAGTGNSDEARARLQQILERPEFNSKPREDPIRSQIARLWAMAMEFLLKVLAPVAAATAGWDLTALWVVLGLLLVGGVVLLVVWELRRSMGPDVAALAVQQVSRAADAEKMRTEALNLAQRNDFRGAIRALYLAVLLRWDERGKFRFDRALTNREVLARVGGSDIGGSSIERLTPLVERFDRFWYGAIPCSADDYADFFKLAVDAWEAP